MREMDDHFGDIYGRISDREIEITHDLAQFVLQYKEVLIACSDVCGELDRYVQICGSALKLINLSSAYLPLPKVRRPTISFARG